MEKKYEVTSKAIYEEDGEDQIIFIDGQAYLKLDNYFDEDEED